MRGVDHPMQMSRRVFDVVVFVLARSALGGNHSATMDVLKIAVGKLIMSFGLLAFFVVHP
jgi:hypothetical protein